MEKDSDKWPHGKYCSQEVLIWDWMKTIMLFIIINNWTKTGLVQQSFIPPTSNISLMVVFILEATKGGYVCFPLFRHNVSP